MLLYGKHKYCVEFVRPLAFVPFPSEAQLLVQQVSVSTHARARAPEGPFVCVCVWVCVCARARVCGCACVRVRVCVRVRACVARASIRECVHQSVYSCARPPVCP